MSQPDHFATSREGLDWAGKAIDELQAACAEFLSDAKNFKHVTDFDEERREYTSKVMMVCKGIPGDLRRKATEALLLVRHSFDQSLYGACVAIGKRPRHILYFPWAQDPGDLEHRLSATVSKGSMQTKIPPEFWPVLRTFEPYSRGEAYTGGDDLIRMLAQIANRKHTVRLNAALQVAGGTLGDFRVESAAATSLEIYQPTWDPVKNEIVLAKYGAGVQASDNHTIYGNVILDEAAPLNTVPVTDALRFFSAKAKTVLEGLEREATLIVRP